MKEKRETYKFERISGDKSVYLISTRQKRAIKTHGTKRYDKNGKSNELTCHYWFLLPGAYYLFEHSNQKKGYNIHRLRIREMNGQIVEEHQPVDYIPDWLRKFLQTLPEYQEKDIEKYTIYPTKQSVDTARD